MILEEAIKNFEQEIGEFEGLKKIKAVTYEDYEYIEKTRQLAEWLKELKERREKDTLDANVRDMISRQAAINTDGLDEEIRCEMCRNPMHTNRGCDGNCKYDEKLYERIMQILDERIKPLPSAQPDNQIHLCDSCRHAYPDCPSGKDDVIFGNGIGNDNICACAKYVPSIQSEPSQVARDIATIIENEQDMRVILKNAQNDIIHCEDCRFRHKSPDWKHRQSFGESIWYCEKGRGLNLAEAVELNDYCSSAKRRTDGNGRD